MKPIEGEGKSLEEIRHDKGHGDRHRTDCRWCRRARAQERVDLLVAEGKLVQG